MEFAVLPLLILLNALFAMSEVALLTARKARLQKLVAEGDRSAAAALAMGENPNRFMSTIQIGITSIGILNGIVGEAAFAQPLSLWLIDLGVPGNYAAMLATALVTCWMPGSGGVEGWLGACAARAPMRIGRWRNPGS